jgi:hypothetical protein
VSEKTEVAARQVSLDGWLVLLGDEAWTWALEKFDRGEQKWLGQLVAAYMQAPELVARYTSDPTAEQVTAVGEIIAGSRKPDRRGQKRGDIEPTKKRAAIARAAEIRAYRDKYISEVREAAKAKRRHPKGWTTGQVRRAFEEAMQACADGYGVTLETLEVWARPSRRTK